MPPSVEISCFTIFIDRQSAQEGLYRRGGAFARMRLDFCVMRRVREWESERAGERESEGAVELESRRAGERANKRQKDNLHVSYSPALPLPRSPALPLSITRTPDSPASASRRLSGRQPDNVCRLRSRPCLRCPGAPRECLRRIHG